MKDKKDWMHCNCATCNDKYVILKCLGCSGVEIIGKVKGNNKNENTMQDLQSEKS
jgi:hypothetical protein